ncbi:MAG: restriction endonuclease subunit S [Deltaproteobacteria bacterium]|uniref:Restriction endonuclease subunit S n=1 Tax=Candidatus Desulfacyla euxinica TaxID=2841693 RepID=A0A8J6MYT5_9DELT|nr:restriction endonuclease subunit S [Candidatus Desulfacyla euxinica]
MNRSLPSTWRYAKLGKCCTVVSGATPRRNVPEYWGNDIPWVTPKDLSNLEGPILKDAPEYISKEGYRGCSTTILPKGSILFSSRAPIGLVSIAGRDMCTNQGFKNLIPGRDVHSGYLYHCMKWLAPKIADMGNGATFKEVSREIVSRVEIPLPSLPEQKRIAAILDKADAIRRKRQQAIKLADEFLRSVFLDMFGDPASNPKGWPLGSIRELISEAKYGTSKKASDATGKYPVLRMNNIAYSGEMDFTDLKYIDLEKKEVNKYLVKKGDLLFNRTNSKELVGKTAVFESNIPMAIAGYLIRVRTNERSTPQYISAYLNSSHGKATLIGMCKSIVGMANINAQELQDINILIPPVTLQKQYSKIVWKVRERKKRHFEAAATGDILFKSLTQRAFRGEL